MRFNTVAKENTRVVLGLAAIVVAMSSLVYYSVPLYRLFCQVTGFGGTTQKVAAAAETVLDRTITVRFDANVAPDLPWRFRPLQRAIKVRLGEQAMAYFEAENVSDEPIVGASTFNVTPQKTGSYFNKIQCFCFDQQRLGPGEKVNMPVLFFVDPTLAEDPNVDEVKTITLSYTFFKSLSPEEGKNLARLDDTAAEEAKGNGTLEGNVGRGRKVFRKCVGCHSLDADKVRIGPSLAALFDRKAGSDDGYEYSEAMKTYGVVWNSVSLNRFLEAPQNLVEGTKMTFPGIKKRQERADLIAYLKRAAGNSTRID